MKNKTLFTQLQTYKATQKANSFVYFLTHSFLFKRFFYEDLVKEYTSKEGVALTIYSIDILWKLTLKMLYLFIIALHVQNYPDSFLMFFALLTVIGAINRPIIGYTQEDYEAIMLLRVPPKKYARYCLHYYLIKEFVLFAFGMIIVCVECELNYFWLLYTIVIYLSIHLLAQGMEMIILENDHFIDKKRGVVRLLIAIGLLAFIGVFYGFKGYASNLICSIIGIIFVVGAIGSYIYLTNYSHYDLAFKYNLNVENYLKLKIDAKKAITGEQYNEKLDLKGKEVKGQGYKYLFKLFINRYHKVLRTRTIIIYFVIALVSLACIFVYPIFQNSVKNFEYCFFIYQRLTNVFWIMYLVVNTMGNKFLQLCFFQVDRYLIHYNFYRSKEAIISNFFLRFKYILKVILIPTLLLSLGLTLPHILYAPSLLWGRICLSFFLPIICAIFYSIFNVAMYYLFQPYSFEGQIVNKAYPIIDRIIYTIAYVVFTNNVVLPDVAIIIICVILMIISVLLYVLAVKNSPRKFRVR